jgi:hypothetical protein
MSVRLKSVLQDLKERGVEKNDLTADEIVALVRACERVDNPFSHVNAELCEMPVKVCKGIYLWPITAGAQIWLDTYAESWWEKDSAMYRFAQIYALRNARNQDAFLPLTEKKDAKWAVIKSGLSLCCHRKELAVAINRCYGIEPYDTEETSDAPSLHKATDFGKLVSSLEVFSGIKASEWLWGKSLVSLFKSYVRLRTLNNVMGGGKDEEYELDEALKNLARVKTMILRRVKENGKQ